MKNIFRRIWHWLCADIVRLLSALILAWMLHYSISVQLRETRTFDAPVRIHTEGGLLGAPSRKNVRITVDGPRRALQQEISGEDFNGQVTVRERDRQPDGRYCVTVTPHMFREYNGIRVKRVDAGELFFDLQRETSILVDVKAQTGGAPNVDYEISSTHCVPNQVRITGPENLISSVPEVKTETIPLTDSITESFERADVKIGALSEGISVDPKTVTVYCEIAARSVEGVIPQIPVEIRNHNNFWEMSIAPRDSSVKGILSGVPSQIADLQAHPNEIAVYPDVSGIDKQGDYEVPLICAVPKSGVTIRIEPKTILIHVKEKEQSILKKVF